MEAQLDEITERRQGLFFPKSLNALTRTKLWLHGYFDARRRKVVLGESGSITSPFCRKLVETADLRINAEWQESNGIMFELRPPLEIAVRWSNEIERRITQLPELKALKIAAAKVSYEGDERVSTHLADKRRGRRVALVESEFAAREARLREELNDALKEVSRILANYQDIKDVSETHERLVRLDYVARLSCYARGASRRMLIDYKFVNDNALTQHPKSDNESFFAACMNEALRGVQFTWDDKESEQEHAE